MKVLEQENTRPHLEMILSSVMSQASFLWDAPMPALLQNRKEQMQMRENERKRLQDSCTDEVLVAKVLREGDKDSFEPLVERYKKPVLTLLFRMTGDYQASLELAQETFLKAWNHLRSYNSDRRFSSWIFKIAHNCAIDHNRQKARSREMEREICRQEATTANREKHLEENLFLQQLIDKLKEPYKTAVVLRFMGDLSYDEIGRIMEATLQQVKNYLFRGRKKLLQLAAEVKLDEE